MFADYRLHHVGIVLPTLEEADAHLAQFGLVEAYRGYVERWSCWCIFTTPAAGAAIELVVPEGGPLARFNKGFGGVHHFAYEVADIAATSAWVEANGMAMLEPQAIRGAGDFLCNFLDPMFTAGVQIELVQPLS